LATDDGPRYSISLTPLRTARSNDTEVER
jgi:hypothetical protein